MFRPETSCGIESAFKTSLETISNGVIGAFLKKKRHTPEQTNSTMWRGCAHIEQFSYLFPDCDGRLTAPSSTVHGGWWGNKYACLDAYVRVYRDGWNRAYRGIIWGLINQAWFVRIFRPIVFVRGELQWSVIWAVGALWNNKIMGRPGHTRDAINKVTVNEYIPLVMTTNALIACKQRYPSFDSRQLWRCTTPGLWFHLF